MVEVSLTVGKLDASLALLLTSDHHLIEFPTILLPHGVKAGSIVKIKCDRDLETELEEQKQFQAIQDEILSTFGKNLPKAPVLNIKNVTQTSCVLEWDPLDLGTASLKSLVLFKDGKKLGAIPQPMTNRTTKLSGLPIDKTFKFQLRLDSTAGVYSSDTIEVTTHKMTDLSGINVCLGDITPNEQFTVEDIDEALKNMGAHHPALRVTRVDTTHYITTRENKQNPEFTKANDMNIPIIRPEWLKACERERRIVGVRDFYVKECVLPDIIAKNYWQKSAPPPPPAKDVPAEPATDNASVATIKGEPTDESDLAVPKVEVHAASPEAETEQAEPQSEEKPVEDKLVEENPEEKPAEVEPTAEKPEDKSVEVNEPEAETKEPVLEEEHLGNGSSVEKEVLAEAEKPAVDIPAENPSVEDKSVEKELPAKAEDPVESQDFTETPAKDGLQEESLDVPVADQTDGALAEGEEKESSDVTEVDTAGDSNLGSLDSNSLSPENAGGDVATTNGETSELEEVDLVEELKKDDEKIETGMSKNEIEEQLKQTMAEIRDVAQGGDTVASHKISARYESEKGEEEKDDTVIAPANSPSGGPSKKKNKKKKNKN